MDGESSVEYEQLVPDASNEFVQLEKRALAEPPGLQRQLHLGMAACARSTRRVFG